MWERKELKKKGLRAFTANYWKCVLVGILMAMFVAGASVGTARTTRSANVANNNAVSSQQMQNAMQDPEVQIAVLGALAGVAMLLFTVWLICSGLRLLIFNPIEVGCRGFFTRNTEAPAGLNVLGTGFSSYGRNVRAMFLRDLFIFLWGLLFLIPAMIKRYSYRMVPYILADNPTIGGLEAITLSREMMDGHKWRTFVLDLSFLGWDILSILTAGVLGVLYVNPYQHSTGAELYQVLKKNVR